MEITHKKRHSEIYYSSKQKIPRTLIYNDSFLAIADKIVKLWTKENDRLIKKCKIWKILHHGGINKYEEEYKINQVKGYDFREKEDKVSNYNLQSLQKQNNMKN